MRRTILLVVALALAAAACGDDTTETTDTTLPASGGDEAPAYVSDVEILLLESYPVQVRAIVTGDLPTPCHELGWRVGEPAADGTIELEVFSTVDPDVVCAQVLEPFEATIDVGSFESGDYMLVVNGDEYPFTI